MYVVFCDRLYMICINIKGWYDMYVVFCDRLYIICINIKGWYDMYVVFCDRLLLTSLCLLFSQRNLEISYNWLVFRTHAN